MSSNLTYTPVSEGMAATPANFNSRFDQIVNSWGTQLSLSTSNVSHGATTFAGTHDFFTVFPYDGAVGGAALRGLAESNSTWPALELAAIGSAATATKTTSTKGLIDLVALAHDGANGLANVTADGAVVSMRARVGGANLTRWILDEDGDTWQTGDLILATSATPASGTASGTTGQIQWDASYIYVCSSTNSWRRATLAAF